MTDSSGETVRFDVLNALLTDSSGESVKSTCRGAAARVAAVPHLRDLAPMLVARDVKETIRFYQEVLGFELNGTWGHDPEKPTWCSLQRGDVWVMFTAAMEPHEHEDGEEDHDHWYEPHMTGSLYFYSDDVDALAVELAGKTKLEWGPQTFEHGMREIGVKDCNGYLLIFGQSAPKED